MENWKPVVGYEDQYEVTDCGEVRQRGTLQIRKLFLNGGYHRVNFSVGKKFLVHRLVLEAFVGLCPIGMMCNHKNGIRTDNRVENLEWVTASQNVQHAYDKLGALASRPRGEKNNLAKLTEREVFAIRELVRRGFLQKRLAEWFRVSKGAISHVRTRRNW